jgi:hypothetical protein
MHAATIEVSDAGYLVTGDDVCRTFQDVLRRAFALGVDVLSVPMLGAGVAGLSTEDSFRGLLAGYHNTPNDSLPKTVALVLYRESQLSRLNARALAEEVLPGDDGIWSDEPWPLPATSGSVRQ